jgi:predicted TIM-barrel enzyme
MEIRAGLRFALGRERIRERRVRPSAQAVSEVKVGRMAEGELSRAASSRGYADSLLVYLIGEYQQSGDRELTSVLAVGRGVSVILKVDHRDFTQKVV